MIIGQPKPKTIWNWKRITKTIFVLFILMSIAFFIVVYFNQEQKQTIRYCAGYLYNKTEDANYYYEKYILEANRSCVPKIIEVEKIINNTIINNTCNYLPYIKTIKRLEAERVSILLLNNTQHCDNMTWLYGRCVDDLNECEEKINKTLGVLE